MTRRTKHLLVILLSVVIATLSVYFINLAYWSVEPWPGGRTARQVVVDCPWLSSGIHDLVRIWSVPLGVVAFLALYGATASILEIPGKSRYYLAVVFVYPIFGFLFAILLIPLFVSVVGAAVLVAHASLTRSKRELWFSTVALAHNLIFAMVSWMHLGDLFGVFGD